MKWPKFELTWILVFGFCIAPFVCVTNAVLANNLYGRRELSPLFLGFLSLILTGPLSFLTLRLIEIWNKGSYGRARSLGLGCGVFSIFFWLWVWRSEEDALRLNRENVVPVFGALLLPFIWSLLFPLLSILARPPKK